MSLAIIGAGSLGLLWASRVASVDKSVYLFTRTSHQKELIQKNGIRVTGKSEFHTHVKVDLLKNFSHYANEIEMIWCMVKQTGVEAVLSQIECVDIQTPIVFWQNGMGHWELAKELLPDHQVFFQAVTTEGAKREDETSVIHTGTGQTWIGPMERREVEKDRLKQLLNKLSESHQLEIEWVENIRQRVWRKLIVNCVVNPLTGILRISNGELLQSQYHPLMENVAREGVELAKACGHDFSLQQILLEIQGILKKTSKNQSSMLQDILQGRPTEIDSLNGYLLQLGRRLQVSTPLQEALVDLIRAIESKA